VLLTPGGSPRDRFPGRVKSQLSPRMGWGLRDELVFVLQGRNAGLSTGTNPIEGPLSPAPLVRRAGGRWRSVSVEGVGSPRGRSASSCASPYSGRCPGAGPPWPLALLAGRPASRSSVAI